MSIERESPKRRESSPPKEIFKIIASGNWDTRGILGFSLLSRLVGTTWASVRV